MRVVSERGWGILRSGGTQQIVLVMRVGAETGEAIGVHRDFMKRKLITAEEAG